MSIRDLASSSYTTLNVGVHRGILVVELARPDKLNALNSDMAAEVTSVFQAVGQATDVKSVVLTGEGRAFMAGADIAGYGRDSRAAFAAFQHAGRDAYLSIRDCGAIVVAAVNGYALGGGLELLLSCDIALASEGARFGLPEGTLGLVPGGGGTVYLPPVVGIMRARHLILSGEIIDAPTALAWGLVQAVHPADELLDAALNYCERLTSLSGPALRGAKRLLDHRGDTGGACLDREHDELMRRFDGDDGQEGIRAFLEKRPPKFAERRDV